MNIKTILACFFLFSGYAAFSQKKADSDFSMYKSIPENGINAVYANKAKSPAERAKDLLSRMTFEEKLAFTGGMDGNLVKGSFAIPGISRLGIRPVTMADASQGIRKIPLPSKENVSGTSFPSLLALTSAWNPDLANSYGKAIGEECRGLGIDILLGPGLNLYRVPTGGRNFEYVGEDPVLASSVVTQYVLGLQSLNVIATPKHVIANDQDFVRHIANSIVSNRALREIYLPPWKAVIEKAKAKALMAGNNTVNGTPCAISKPVLNDILRNEYGFTGIAMTDWQNTNYFPSMQDRITGSGISLLMPSNQNFINYIDELKKSGKFNQKDFEQSLDKMVYENLLPIFESGIYDRGPVDEKYLSTFNAHKELARKCAEESMILLKNENNTLPLANGSKKILLVGKESHSGEGSGSVKGYDHTSYFDGLRNVYGEEITTSLRPAEAEVKAANTVIFIVDKKTGEGRDVPWDEPREQLAQLRQILSWNSNVIVIVNAANSMPMDWAPKAKAVLWGIFLGQERGNALADIISGKVSPSGKLPFTIETDFKNSVAPDYNYLCGKPFWGGNNEYKGYWLNGKDVKIPGFSDCVKPLQFVDIPYNEDIFIGYRWYDKKKYPVAYPFGFGLSYTTFQFKDLKVDNRLSKGGDLKVTVSVTNTGKMTGKEVVQLYISDLDGKKDDRPLKELKSFSKVELLPGETKKVTMKLTRDDFAIWVVSTDKWKIKTGKYEIKVGPSSGQLEQKAVIAF